MIARYESRLSRLVRRAFAFQIARALIVVRVLPRDPGVVLVVLDCAWLVGGWAKSLEVPSERVDAARLALLRDLQTVARGFHPGVQVARHPNRLRLYRFVFPHGLSPACRQRPAP